MTRAEWQLPAHEVHEFAARRHTYCVVIPVINEGERIRRQLEKMRAIDIAGMADIIIADGGSTDGSLERTELLHLGVRTLLIKTGPGRLSAQLRMAYAYALDQGYEGIVTIDGNNKDGPEAIPRFVQELQAGADMVQGSRFVPGGVAVNTPLVRMLAIRLIHAPVLSLAAGFHYTDTTNGFRGYGRRYLLDPRVQPFREVFATYELLTYLSVRAPQLGLKTMEVPVARVYPAKGPTPTKINVGGYFGLLRILGRTLLGSYQPRPAA